VLRLVLVELDHARDRLPHHAEQEERKEEQREAVLGGEAPHQ
jgi:hypothetical protein